MKKSDFNLKSKCCNAPVRTETGMPDFIGDKNPRISTMWYVCTECGGACDTQENMVDKTQNKTQLVNQHITPDWSITITKADNGFICECLEELMGEEGDVPAYHRVQTVFESPEFEADDLEAFQKLVWHLKDHFGVECGTVRRLDLALYDPNAKPKKGKK